MTGNKNQIWSHKWVLDGGALNVDGTKIFAYLTVPEDAMIGVCCHELGHLLFGFPDLYDTDQSSEGIGNWCLMAAGSWGGTPAGSLPVHPSAWCKANQGWVAVDNRTSNATLNIPDVKQSHTVYRLWKNGDSNPEYFLLENREQAQFDASLPSGGLLIWHIDETTPDNTNENHYRIALVQADGQRDLERAANRGDAGDPYPGIANNFRFDNTSAPNSKSYNGLATSVSVTNIGAAGATMTARVGVRAGSPISPIAHRQSERQPAIAQLERRISAVEEKLESIAGDGQSSTEYGNETGDNADFSRPPLRALAGHTNGIET